MKKLLLLLIIPFLSISQIDTLNYTDGVYVGEVNNDGLPHGHGEKKYNDDGVVFNGIFKDGSAWSGHTVVWRYPDKSHYFTGEVQDGKPWSGDISIKDRDDVIVFTGELKNGVYWDGYLLKKDCGERQKINIENGKRNDRNHYNKKDIIGNRVSTTVKLKGDTFNIYQWKDNSLFVTMQLGEVEHDWHFDTGAEGFNIPKKEWIRLKKNVKYKSLDICQATEGIMGSSNGDLVQIDEIKIGDYIVKNVIVEISDTDKSLVGISFFEKFSNCEWNMKKNTLTLYK